MTLQIEHDQGQDCRARLEGEMSIYVAHELMPQLLDVLASHDTVELQLDGITELDTAGIQLLLLLEREATAAGKSVTFSRHSQAVRAVLELLHLDPELAGPVNNGPPRRAAGASGHGE